MFDGLSIDKQKELFVNSLNKGDVLLKEFDEAEHEKFFIITGKSQNKVFVCSIFINSLIHPSLYKKPKLLALQIPLKQTDNDFLKYDSFANCAYPIILNTEEIADRYIERKCKVIGTIRANDLVIIQETLTNSGLLSEEEIEMFLK